MVKCLNCDKDAVFSVENPGAHTQKFCKKHLPPFFNINDLPHFVKLITKPEAPKAEEPKPVAPKPAPKKAPEPKVEEPVAAPVVEEAPVVAEEATPAE